MLQDNQLLYGAIDMHVHFAPDPSRERKDSALGLARQAAEAGMRGVVLEAHHYCSTPVCSTVNEIDIGAELFGSLVLSRSLGGLNPRAVEVAAALGTRVLWMPTTDSVVDAARRGEEGVRLTGEDSTLLPEVGRILEIVKKHDMLLCTGHIGPEEVFALVRRAVGMGIASTIRCPSPIGMSRGSRIGIFRVPGDEPV